VGCPETVGVRVAMTAVGGHSEIGGCPKEASICLSNPKLVGVHTAPPSLDIHPNGQPQVGVQKLRRGCPEAGSSRSRVGPRWVSRRGPVGVQMREGRSEARWVFRFVGVGVQDGGGDARGCARSARLVRFASRV
jgi:hypothetical protein